MNPYHVKIICILIISIFLTATISYPLTESDPINTDDAEVPQWEQGTIWTYAIDEIDIQITDDLYPGLTLNIQGFISEFPVIVEEVTQTTYELSFDAVMNAKITIESTGQDTPIKAQVKTSWIMKPKISGSAIVTKSDLGLKELTIDFSGSFIARLFRPIITPALRVPIKFSLTSTFDIPLKFMDFPVYVEKIWGIPETTVDMDGKIQSIWLRPINVMHKIVRLFNLIPDHYMNLSNNIDQILPIIDVSDAMNLFFESNQLLIPEFTTMFCCNCTETVTVPAGSFDVYNISLANISHFWYSEEAKNLVKLQIDSQQFIPYIEDISMELISVEMP